MSRGVFYVRTRDEIRVGVVWTLMLCNRGVITQLCELSVLALAVAVFGNYYHQHVRGGWQRESRVLNHVLVINFGNGNKLIKSYHSYILILIIECNHCSI